MNAGTKFYAPSTINDLGLGLDTMSYAVEDFGVDLIITPKDRSKGLTTTYFVLKDEAIQRELTTKLHVLHRAFETYFDKQLDYHLDITIRIPVNSHLNMTGPCLSAFLVAINTLNRSPFEQRQLFDFTINELSGLLIKDKLSLANALIGGLVVGYDGSSIDDYQRVSMPLGFTSTLLLRYRNHPSFSSVPSIPDLCSKRANTAVQLSLAMYKSDFDRLDVILQTDQDLLEDTAIDDIQNNFISLAKSLGCDFVFSNNPSCNTLVCMGMNSFKVSELADQFKETLKAGKVNDNYKIISVRHNHDGCYRC